MTISTRLAISGHTVRVDCAGAHMGGARRYLDELDAFLAERVLDDVEVVGRGLSVTPSWLVRRERPSCRHRLVALNNVSFVTSRSERWVLLRNALHFLTPDEPMTRVLPRSVRMQIPVVRKTAARADVLVVPTSIMAERVSKAVPRLQSRLVIRPHPVTPLAQARSTACREVGLVLCPVLFAPYKDMGTLLRIIDEAASRTASHISTPLRVVVTATDNERVHAGLGSACNLTFIGRLSTEALTSWRARSTAILYPTRIESFGYPLAEAQVERRPVVALDTAHNREVAGNALIGYSREDPDEIAAALARALTTALPSASTERFERDPYFRWLFNLPEEP
ncbi:mannosyltransferase [Candidatus Protofrankia californiensis]|uniref:Mannosyltransferase n=1 Tax=Candidatus Protofrankia californiensis TaxID=1839754 RepID=A0A1C3NXT1_9ACTN|nr:mannosyltransferase [Candidatus Protofrankia californiensis]